MPAGTHRIAEKEYYQLTFFSRQQICAHLMNLVSISGADFIQLMKDIDRLPLPKFKFSIP